MAYISFQPSDYFNTKLYTGNGSTQSITGVGFQPDWLWIKNRDGTNNHILQDAVRGATKSLESDGTGAETTSSTRVTSFDSDGFSIGSAGTNNTNTNNYVSWNWKANGSGSANTDGDINSTVSANTTSGFSIVKYTGNGSSNQTVGHGLGVAPAVIMYKGIDAVHNWLVYHQSLGATQGIVLNLSGVAVTGSGYFDNTAPTSSVFSVSTTGGNDQNNVSSEDYIAYCFAEKKGFSKFGSYTGNGSADGTFIYTGFKPAFFLYKLSSANGQNWTIHDNKRIGYNPVGHLLHPDLSNAESNQQSGSLYVSDFCSNGIKIRGTDSNINGSGNTYIYLAFAEHPLVSSNDIPATAR